MKVIVDTCVWSLALRKKRKTSSEIRITGALADLVGELRVCIIGPIRQEILSGIREHDQFELVRKRLRPFADIVLECSDFELAAEYFNRCRARGVQGSNTDFLICAVADRRRLAVFTLDKDFDRFHEILGTRLFNPA
jgi:predicted nucleic acid-binding protein